MTARVRWAMLLVWTGGTLLGAGTARSRGENLQQAWATALSVNEQLQAERIDSMSAGLNVSAAKAARVGSINNTTINVLVTPRPSFSGNVPSGGVSGFGLLGPNQHDVPISNTAYNFPLYSGGRLKNNVRAAQAQLNAQRANEFRATLDLKLALAEAYVGVLRADKQVRVAQSNVVRLESFLRDVKNRVDLGMAIRVDELSAEVSLAEARQSEIQARRDVEASWATYNRYLCRPPRARVPLDELSIRPEPAEANLDDLAQRALRSDPAFSDLNDGELQLLTTQALQSRPELVNLSEQARSLGAQAEGQLSDTRPQVSLSAGYTYLGLGGLSQNNLLTSSVLVNWALTDFGATRRKSEALRQQQRATLRRRANAAADIALEVRTRWLDLEETRRRVPVAQGAIAQAEEAAKVLVDRYNQGVSTYTQVLDAEAQRIRAYTNYYDAVYQAVLAAFRLHRAIGDL